MRNQFFLTILFFLFILIFILNYEKKPSKKTKLPSHKRQDSLGSNWQEYSIPFDLIHKESNIK
jgi:hypothetical protein